jgi:hypothetical protein
MDNVQKHNTCNNIPSSQTFKFYLHNQYGPGIYPNFRKFEKGSEIGASSIYWIQLSTFYLRTETESSLRNIVFFKKWTTRWIMSKNIILVIIYHRHKRLNLNSLKCFLWAQHLLSHFKWMTRGVWQTGCQGEYLDQRNCLLRSSKVVFCS